MSRPSSSLRAFLATAKRTLQNAISGKEQINFVIGNESADLDSITSSIVFAYFRSLSQPSSKPLYVPLLNIPRSDIRLRAELLKLLPYANIEPDHLITLDDLPSTSNPKEMINPVRTRWILVDHNALQGSLGETYADSVVGCIDHHVEENKVPRDSGDEPRVIKPTGSCTSLVVNHFRDSWERLSQSSSDSKTAQGQSDAEVGSDDAAVRKTWDAQIARFALASILVDTSDLRSKDKVTDDDEKAVRYLEGKINVAPKSGGSFDRRGFFKEINKAKRDLEGMGLNDLLRKDFKQWLESGVKIGISSVVQSLSYMLSLAADSKDDFLDELKSFAKERDLGLLAVMTKSNSPSGVFQKEILLLSVDPSAKSIVERFEHNTKDELRLEPWDEQQLSSEEASTKIWWQRNVERTRKQVAPMLRDAANA